MIAEAATVIVLRDAPGVPEVLLIRRSKNVAFMADAYVFPGGRVDPADGAGEDRFARAAARELAEEADIALPASALMLVAHWLTPSIEPRRYDTKFFIAVAPAGQIAKHDEHEAVAHVWATAADLLAREELKLPPPTWGMLREIARLGDKTTILAWARTRQVQRITPKIVAAGDEMHLYLPWHPDYAAQPGEGNPIPATHPVVGHSPSRLVLKDGRWWAK